MNRAEAVQIVASQMPSIGYRQGDTLHLKLEGPVGKPAGSDRKRIDAVAVEAILARHKSVGHIECTIRSRGSKVDEGFRIYNLLRRHSAFVTTIADGLCASAATVILMAGDFRMAWPKTEFLIHSTAVSEANSRWTADQLRAVADSVAKTDRRLIDLYERRTGTSRGFFTREMRNEDRMSTDIA